MTMTEQGPDTARDMLLLEQIETDPDVSQASLASQLGVAVGTVNWHLKRLVSKGYVKVKRAQRRKLRYLITPQGISLRAQLTVDYVERSMRMYRKTRDHVQALLKEARAAGYDSIRLEKVAESPNDIADICRLTCLEQGMTILNDGDTVPVLKIYGQKVHLEMNGANGH